ncbi:MAG TPA: mechanosensitive ion channel [Candidatus Paceibacterota bacterium]|nr:mechanosensitive ion channel [Verrucomicrobiota bacterium]HOX00862.1 mechanosensitive ion channel [Verrucomicrobiota bacterium]HRZ43613.1 mechanosensitive ion channel [Candidatus Paceibacterota bacterium]HRZ94094.1 mechanosensitive ion channel [Candidatus Paceibacterota bacterium]
MQAVWTKLVEQFSTYAPNLLAALAVLVVGWLVARAAAFLVRKLLNNISLDNKLARWIAGPDAKQDLPIEDWCARGLFYLLMLFVLMGFFYTLKLPIINEPLQGLLGGIVGFLPKLLAGAILAIVAWVIATALRRVLLMVLTSAKIDERLGGAASVEPGKAAPSMSKSLAEAVYWLIFVLFLPAILEALEMNALLQPVNTLLNKVFAFLPNLLAAGATLLVGWFVARIVQRLTSSLLASAGVDRLSQKWGLSSALGKKTLSDVLGLVLYFLILIPVMISALNGLQLDAVTKPASDMLGKIMLMLPGIFGAALVLLIAWFVSRVISGLVANLLAGVGFDKLPVSLGLAKAPLTDRRAPSAVVGFTVQIAIILFASMEAARLLQFDSLATMINEFVGFASHIVTGLLIFCLGLALAQIVVKAISTSDSPNARRFAMAARIAILALVGAMALRQTGLANEIITLAFGLVLGAAALAFAIAFGLGGRDAASRSLTDWTQRWNKP